MKREIKFRVWCPFLKRFALDTEDGYIYQKDNFCGGEFGIGCGDEGVIQQFTGLQDKNNKEIYDGDILQYNNLRYEVRWDEYKWKAVCSYYNKYHWPTIEPFGLVGCSIVVGNIFENPELLEKK